MPNVKSACLRLARRAFSPYVLSMTRLWAIIFILFSVSVRADDLYVESQLQLNIGRQAVNEGQLQVIAQTPALVVRYIPDSSTCFVLGRTQNYSCAVILHTEDASQGPFELRLSAFEFRRLLRSELLWRVPILQTDFEMILSRATFWDQEGDVGFVSFHNPQSDWQNSAPPQLSFASTDPLSSTDGQTIYVLQDAP